MFALFPRADFVVLPMFKQLVALAPQLANTLTLAGANREAWGRVAAGGGQPPS